MPDGQMTPGPSPMPMGAPMPGRPPIPPGTTAPATVPPQNAGIRARGMHLAGIILTLVKSAVPMMGNGTEEEQDLLKVAGILSKRFGQAQPDLTRQEVKIMGERAVPQSQPSPDQAAAIKARLGQMGLGGGGGAPPMAATEPGKAA